MKKMLIFMILLMNCCFQSANIVTHDNVDVIQVYTKAINGKIQIPKIGLEKDFYDNGNVDKNIIVIKPSEHPIVEKSLLILAAHSGSGRYAHFNYLYKLNVEDSIYIICNEIKYKYKIIDIFNVEKDGKIPVYRINNKRTLILITCTNNNKRLQTVYVSIEI